MTEENNARHRDSEAPGIAKPVDSPEPLASGGRAPEPEAGFAGEPTPRQMDILVFLNLVGEADEGDIAYSLRLAPEELARVPAAFLDSPGEYVARRELEALARLGLVVGDGVTWELTGRGKDALQALERGQPHPKTS
ncbi:hypothetical protein [Candidatus Desulforudis audaxviator]|uniref:Uncharacterized protein n=1 Tax=Desulforudis audaxviator (strain MP104C) TaxID=477974 RepID=B1I5Q8_DESAP|nr:hypothetical protein [Candidatus Desulforudis audaxviator]ACA60357.1 hypothetical protein Daud_1864 [Candidatus Desulforudis audaxviator MP104C]AZK60412.1 hypothetical protein Daudx_1880 [Candidatus Desulforudis audaxviator]